MSELTHSWNGTVLTITSASGTTSMDLKGEKGDDGARGPQGPAGENGSSSIQLDTTLTQEGYPADAKAVGDAINEAITSASGAVSSVNSKTGDVVLTASDVGALPDTTEIPSIEGLATTAELEETYNYLVAEIAKKQPKVHYATSQPSGWVNGDIWLKPAT